MGVSRSVSMSVVSGESCAPTNLFALEANLSVQKPDKYPELPER